MATQLNEPTIDAPIPGMGMTHELGGRPWQVPPQHTTIENALDFYIPRLTAKKSRRQLFDTLEMGIPVTTIANSIQLSSVIEGKHTVDVGMLVTPIIMEFIMLMADEVNIEDDAIALEDSTDSTKEDYKISNNEQNDDFSTLTDFLDFTENNPFGDPENN